MNHARDAELAASPPHRRAQPHYIWLKSCSGAECHVVSEISGNGNTATAQRSPSPDSDLAQPLSGPWCAVHFIHSPVKIIPCADHSLQRRLGDTAWNVAGRVGFRVGIQLDVNVTAVEPFCWIGPFNNMQLYFSHKSETQTYLQWCQI